MFTNRSEGLSLKESVIQHFSSNEFMSNVKKVLEPDSLAGCATLPTSINWKKINQDMAADDGWGEEAWIQKGSDVSAVAPHEFHAHDPQLRFSLSEILRKPHAEAYGLRGFLAGLRSKPVAEAMQKATGIKNIQYKAAEIARYRPGHYLRRHDDVFDGRVFATVFFLHTSWKEPYGTYLVAEKPDGRSAVVSPLPGTYALMKLTNGHYHFVTQNTSTSWDRYSIAVHWGVKS